MVFCMPTLSYANNERMCLSLAVCKVIVTNLYKSDDEALRKKNFNLLLAKYITAQSQKA